MGHFLHFHPIIVAALVVFVLAALKGGEAERVGAALMVADWVLTLASSWLAGHDVYQHVRLLPANVAVFIDFFFSLGLLVMALRFSKLWVGAALMLQGVMLAMHALSLSPDAPGFLIYAATMNLVTCCLLLSLLMGTISAWSRRKRRQHSGGAPHTLAIAPA